jgi:hypothetical protein
MKFMCVQAMAMLAEYEEAIAMADSANDQTAHNIQSGPNRVATSGQSEAADPTICPSCGGALFSREIKLPRVASLHTAR